jgi:hypothetical protein
MGAGKDTSKEAFNATQIPGLVAWWSSNRIGGAFPPSGSLVRWEDASGNGNHLSGTFVNLLQNFQNGEPVVQFGGTSGTMVAPSFLFSGSMARSMVLVFNHHGTGVYGMAIAGQSGDGGGSDGTGTHFTMLSVGTGTTGDALAHVLGDQVAGPALDWESWKIAEISYDGTNVRVFRNGVEEGSSAIPLNTSETFAFRLGSSNELGPAEYLDGEIGEVLIFDHNLTDFERAQNNSYLSQKWDIPLS